MILIVICIVSLIALCAYMVFTDIKIRSETYYLYFSLYTSLSGSALPKASPDKQGEKEFSIISSASPNTKWLKNLFIGQMLGLWPIFTPLWCSCALARTKMPDRGLNA